MTSRPPRNMAASVHQPASQPQPRKPARTSSSFCSATPPSGFSIASASPPTASAYRPQRRHAVRALGRLDLPADARPRLHRVRQQRDRRCARRHARDLRRRRAGRRPRLRRHDAHCRADPRRCRVSTASASSSRRCSAAHASRCRSTSASAMPSSHLRHDADYPTLLDAPAPRIRAYPHEAVVAEKLHAMVVLGERNSRYKDFYDLYVAGATVSLRRRNGLRQAIAATFERRRTPIDAALPAALTPRFFADDARAEQWRAYLTRNALPGAPADFAAVGELLQAFLGPIWSALAADRSFADTWPPAARGQRRVSGKVAPGRLAAGMADPARTVTAPACAASSRTRPTRTPASSGWGRFRRIGR